MRTIGLPILTALTLSVGVSASDYLSSLAGKNSAQYEAKKPITTDDKMSVVLLSFEREEAMRKEREKAKKQEAERKAKEAKRNKHSAADKKTVKNESFPSLDEQMQAFREGRMITNGKDYLKQKMEPNKQVAPQQTRSKYYGTLCKGKHCYLLGENRLYKQGDLVDGKKIANITADYVKFEDKDKEWFTR
ncbi:MAG: hypothetical protein JXO44_14920 [Clostridia bacterium]|nr:hypothetical protein [Clostridia bacterium]